MSADTVVSRRQMVGVSLVGIGLLAGGAALNAEVAVDTRGSLSRLDPSRSASVYLREDGREGIFRWQLGDFAEEVSGDPLQGIYVPGRDGAGRHGAWMRSYDKLRPEMFGAKGFGRDDTDALQAFLDHLQAGTAGQIDGEHTISRELILRGINGFSLEGSGRIMAAAGMPSSYGYGLLRIAKCHDFAFRDIRFDGNRMQREPAERPAHSLIIESCSNFVCERLRSDNAVVDGYIFLSETPADQTSHCHDFRVIDCHADNCFRQGCSVIQGRNGIFIGGSYTGTNGTAPSAGIDLEPDRGDAPYSIQNIRLSGVRFEGNHGYGLVVSSVSGSREVQVTDCIFVNNMAGAISWGSETGNISGVQIEGFDDDALRGAIDIPSGVNCRSLVITNTTFRDVAASTDRNPLIYVHGESGGNVVIDGLQATGCAAVASLWAANCKLLNSTLTCDKGAFHGAILVYGSDCEVTGNVITNFYGAVIYAEGERFQAHRNRLDLPRYNDLHGCIGVTSLAGVLSQNHVSSANGGRVGMAIRRPAIVTDNQIEGFDIPVRFTN